MRGASVGGLKKPTSPPLQLELFVPFPLLFCDLCVQPRLFVLDLLDDPRSQLRLVKCARSGVAGWLVGNVGRARVGGVGLNGFVVGEQGLYVHQ